MIIPMKKAQICVLKDDKDELLKSLQRYGELMVIKDDSIESSDYDNDLSVLRAQRALKSLNNYEDKKERKYHMIDYDELMKDNPELSLLAGEVEEYEEKIMQIKNDNDILNDSLEHYTTWEKIDIKLSEIPKLKYAVAHFGFIENTKLDETRQILNENDSIFNYFKKTREGNAICFINYNDKDITITEQIKYLGFNEIYLPKDDEYVSEIIISKKQKIKENEENIIVLQKELKKLSARNNELRVLNEKIKLDMEIKKTPFMATIQTIYLEGWVRSDRIDRLEKAISEATDVYELVITNPKEDEIPPTYTKNSKYVEPFETITDMFARPHYKEVDPNPTMSFWYWIIFGMMVGDVGYGIVMICLFQLYIKVKKPKGEALKLFKVLQLSGIPTIFAGLIYGSFFGYEIPFYSPLINLQKDGAMTLLIVSIGIGFLHIITGISVKAYANIKNKDYAAAIFDQFTWILAFIGIVIMLISFDIGKWILIVCVLTILFTAGRAKKGIIGKIGVGLGSLYNSTGYLSDILSYSRILALAMSSAIIGMVMNMLAEMVLGVPFVGIIFFIIILLIGHIFNLAMGLLSAYVHDSRLQYIEYFGKFYEGGGKEFKPLAINLKYVDQVNDNIT